MRLAADLVLVIAVRGKDAFGIVIRFAFKQVSLAKRRGRSIDYSGIR